MTREPPDEFSRIITIQLSDYEAGLDLVGEFLVEREAPAGTWIISYHPNGEVRDRFVLGP